MRSSCRRSEWMLVAAHAAARDGAREAVGVELALHEHEHRAHRLAAQQRREERRLSLLRHRIDALRDAARRLLRADDDDDRVVEDVVGELADVGRHRRREHQRLPSLRQRGQDAADVGQEAHVEHAVGLVEHQHLERGEVDVAEAHVVEEPAGRRDHDLRPGAERALLRPHVDAADDRHRRDADVVAERQRLLVDLQRQLARRRQDERAAASRATARRAGAAGSAAGTRRSCRCRSRRSRSGRGRRARPGWPPPGSASAGCTPCPATASVSGGMRWNSLREDVRRARG